MKYSYYSKSEQKLIDLYFNYLYLNKSRVRLYFLLNKMTKRLDNKKLEIKLDRNKLCDYLNKLTNLYLKIDPSIKSSKEVIYLKQVKALLMHRLIHYLYINGYIITSTLLKEKVKEITLIDIHPNATLGVVAIDHGCGVVIGETAEIKDGVVIYQNVTIGAINPLTDKFKRHPTIEKNCIIYANSLILGKGTLKENEIVKAGSIIKLL